MKHCKPNQKQKSTIFIPNCKLHCLVTLVRQPPKMCKLWRTSGIWITRHQNPAANSDHYHGVMFNLKYLSSSLDLFYDQLTLGGHLSRHYFHSSNIYASKNNYQNRTAVHILISCRTAESRDMLLKVASGPGSSRRPLLRLQHILGFFLSQITSSL